MKQYLMIICLSLMMIGLTACGEDNISNITSNNPNDLIVEGFEVRETAIRRISDIDELKEISIEEMLHDNLDKHHSIEHQYFKIDGSTIFPEQIKLEDYKRYVVDGEELYISTILLEGQAYLPSISHGEVLEEAVEGLVLKANINNQELQTLLTKCIGYSNELDIFPHIDKLDYSFEKYQTSDMVMVYKYYPLCYKVEYQGQEYRVLKRKESSYNGITKIYADCIIDIQQFLK